MKKIDLIALDLDGTALNPQNQVSPATADAVRRARESGIHVVVSTGRICGEARDFALMLGTDDQMVTSGGATLSSVSRRHNEDRLEETLEVALDAAVLDLIERDQHERDDRPAERGVQVCRGGAHRHDHNGVCRRDAAHYPV